MASSLRAQILEINRRKDLNAKEKTILMQKLRTPNPEVNETASGGHHQEDYSRVYDGVTSVRHLKNPNGDEEFAACAVHVLRCPTQILEDDDFCIFSRQVLKDHTFVGCIVVSPNDTERGAGDQLKWQFVCNDKPKSSGDLRGVHFFTVKYLSDWVKQCGPQYIQCPLCRKGATKKKAVSEEDIEALDQLLEDIKRAENARDEYMVYFKQQSVIQKVCKEYWDPVQNEIRKKQGEGALEDILGKWYDRRPFEEYEMLLYTESEVAIEHSNVDILQIMLKHWEQKNAMPQDRFAKLLEIACLNCEVECVQLLLDAGAAQSGDCRSLLACAKARNLDLFEKIVASMLKQQNDEEGKEEFWSVDQVFLEILYWDCLPAMKHIFEKRWKGNLEVHEQDKASQFDGNVKDWLENSGRINPQVDIIDEPEALKRQYSDIYVPNIGDDDWGDDDNGDDDWGDDDDDEEMEEN